MGLFDLFISAPKPGLIPVDQARLKKHVQRLCNTSKPRQYKNPAALKEAADYVRTTLQGFGFKVVDQAFKARGKTYRNLIARYGPATGPRVVLGAHYDVCGNQPGADDNASGVAGLLEIARLLNRLKPKVRHSIELVGFTLEEPPFFATKEMGSFVHAQALRAAGVKLRGMLCLEMIGYFSDKPNSQKFPIRLMRALFPTTGNFVAVVGNLKSSALTRSVRNAMKAASSIDVQTLTSPAFVTGVDFSDHRNYWRQGYPAVMITDTSFFRNPHYHKPSDTIGTLDFKRMAEVVRGTYHALTLL